MGGRSGSSPLTLSSFLQWLRRSTQKGKSAVPPLRIPTLLQDCKVLHPASTTDRIAEDSGTAMRIPFYCYSWATWLEYSVQVVFATCPCSVGPWSWTPHQPKASHPQSLRSVFFRTFCASPATEQPLLYCDACVKKKFLLLQLSPEGARKRRQALVLPGNPPKEGTGGKKHKRGMF